MSDYTLLQAQLDEQRALLHRTLEYVNELAVRVGHASKQSPKTAKQSTVAPRREALTFVTRHDSDGNVIHDKRHRRKGVGKAIIKHTPVGHFVTSMRTMFHIAIFIVLIAIFVCWAFWTYIVPQPAKWGMGMIIPGACTSEQGGTPPMVVKGVDMMAHDAGRGLTSYTEWDVDPASIASAYYGGKEAVAGTYQLFMAGLRKEAGPQPKTWIGGDRDLATPGGVQETAYCAPEDDLRVFEAALTGQESGGSFTARNARTGAYGAYQIMPSNWGPWSAEAGLPGVPQTAANQQTVARFKLNQYRAQFGSWPAVAVAWYAGPSAAERYLADPNDSRWGRRPAPGEPSVRDYVQQVMSRMPVLGADVAPETNKILQYARAELGKPYEWGATPWSGSGPRPSTYDCSSFVDSAYLYAGIEIPGRATTKTLINAGQRITVAQARAGDLIFLNSGHVGLIAGDGTYIHAPQTGDVVKISKVPASPWAVVRLGSGSPALQA